METSTKAGIFGTLGVLALLCLPLLDPLTRARFVNDWVSIRGFPLLLLLIIAVAERTPA